MSDAKEQILPKKQTPQTGLPTEYSALCSEHFEASTLITQEMRKDLQIDFFPRNVLWTFLWDPTEKHKYPKSPPKKIDFFSDWVGLFEICFRSSEMTDPRPCPRGWAYLRVPSCSKETCQAQTNNKLSAANIDIFRGQRNITGKAPSSQQTSISHD